MLKKLVLSHNLFSGPVPKTLGNLRHLERFRIVTIISSQDLPTAHEWSFLSSLSNCRHLRKIEVSGNPLSGDSTETNLSRNLLTGDILSTFGVLQTLVSLDLSNNILHGHIPESLMALYLKYFNVSFNRLQGEIPSKGCFSNFSSTSFMKNYALCVGTVVVLIVLTIMYRRCQRRSATLPIKDDLLSLKTPRRISHAELSRATNGFEESNMLGSGSFGCVYKGRLSDGMEVAIKVFNLQTEGAFRSFDIECDAMRNIVHRNIVNVITCCSSVDFKALVLDYMSNGNLEKWLHSENCFLDIIQRVDIMIDVAVAIEHLHNGHPTPIIHCDIKPSNILLDEDMVAHVGDFGVAKLLGEGEVMKQTMTLATTGYMAPEFGSTGIVSIKCDVYSYGIILIETFIKKKPTDNLFAEEVTIRHWMECSLPKGAIEIADADLLRKEDEYFVVKANCISAIMELALNCSAELPEERKDMKDVVVELKKIKQRLLNNINMFNKYGE
ncbi:hypothetical protein V6Z11_1Z010000 [Gossypium hirsutum]